jgi:uncharacterized protein (DUF1778 family)
MPTFHLDDNPTNRVVAGFLEKINDDIRVQVESGKIRIKSEFAIEISKLEMGSAIPALTDMDWTHLYRQISRTLRGGRLWPPRRNFDREETWVIKVLPLKTKRITMRFDPLEYSTLKEAADLAKKSVGDFVRSTVMQAIYQQETKETMRKQQERKQKELKQSEKAPQRYVT